MNGVNSKNELVDIVKNSDSENERIMALLHLGNEADEEMVKALFEQLEVEKSDAVREAIVDALIRIGNNHVAKYAADLLGSEDASLRNTGVEILSAIGDAALGVFEELIVHPDRDVRIMTVNAIGDNLIDEAPALLRKVIAEDEDVNVVATAIEYLGETGYGEEDKRVIESALRRFSDPFLEYTAKLALERLGE